MIKELEQLERNALCAFEKRLMDLGGLELVIFSHRLRTYCALLELVRGDKITGNNLAVVTSAKALEKVLLETECAGEALHNKR